MIDLHAHTRASDGDKTPEELIDLAIEKNIKAITVTDHDTIDGVEVAASYAKDKKIMFIPGVELSAKVPKGQMHIVGLFIDYKNKELQEKLLQAKNERDTRNNKFIEELNKMGFEISLEELKEISNGKIIGKPHFAKIFIKKGYITKKVEMFDNYFNKPPLNQYKHSSMTPEEVIKLIKNANGVAILAHPQTLKLTDSELVEKIKELKSYGLDGLECYHSSQTPEQMKRYKEIAKELDLLTSKGSDYHGPIAKPDIELGTGKENNIVSNEEKDILKNLINCYIKQNEQNKEETLYQDER